MNPSFTFLGHTLDKKTGKVSFSYELQTEKKKYTFSETLFFPLKDIAWENIPERLLSKILDNLLLILGISYWKTICPTIIKTPTIQLTQEQAEFWNTLYTKGMGEFYYKNNIDYRNLVHFPFDEKSKEEPMAIPRQNRSLVFFGGGKDSIVSGEILKENNKQFTLFIVGESDIQKQTAEMVGKEQINFKKIIDPQLFKLNKENDVYNGHIPISAVWAFLGLFAAILYDYTYIITSHEHSASYGNVEYLGQEINHQWSKSFEFETLFQTYSKNYITENITYFSLLRLFHELKIAQIFARYPQYFLYFSSCNRNFTINKRMTGRNWCSECPKCVFVFILLSAYIPKKELIEIFGKNLLDDPTLLPIVKDLLGLEHFKPFDCVGTPEETKLALLYAFETENFGDNVSMQFFMKDVLPNLDKNTLEKKVFSIKTVNLIPHEFKEIISKV